ncbi:tyrosine-type recombinase/integrase [Amycolatopsis regifaucium]|uniref:tyrosine-type recombinase/integrase n=1 Tax=Amycolatopsis regifaucium TaxID=546365 RepID=UPI001ABF5C02|nr:site-specific integrase [Amycolatopsis regifaucium]
MPWLLVDPANSPVKPVETFLADFAARGNAASSVRSYAFDLLRWWRWLLVVDVRWDCVTSAESRGFVLWLTATVKPRRNARTGSAATAGQVNPITRKASLNDQYQARTIRHSNAVIRSFYEFWLDEGSRPLINPMPLDARRGRRAPVSLGERPMNGARIRYNPRLPKRLPRAMPDPQWAAVFAALRSNRDRAIVAMAVSCGARPSELLGVRGVDLDWGEQLVRVIRKGSRAEQWLPVSAEAFVWLRLYIAELGDFSPSDPVWQTLRRRDRGDGLRRQPLNYEAYRAVFRRLNAALGTNWTPHDLRHTAGIRMSRDIRLSMRDVQTILGHAHLTTTADIYLIENHNVVLRRVAEHLSTRDSGHRPRQMLRPRTTLQTWRFSLVVPNDGCGRAAQAGQDDRPRASAGATTIGFRQSSQRRGRASGARAVTGVAPRLERELGDSPRDATPTGVAGELPRRQLAGAVGQRRGGP